MKVQPPWSEKPCAGFARQITQREVCHLDCRFEASLFLFRQSTGWNPSMRGYGTDRYACDAEFIRSLKGGSPNLQILYSPVVLLRASTTARIASSSM